DQHARALADDLVRGARAAELLRDDRRLQGVGRLLRAAVPARDVPVEVALFGRLQTERGRPVVAGDRPGVRRHPVAVRLARRIVRAPVLLQEPPDFGSERLVLRAVLEIHRAIAYQLIARSDKRWRRILEILRARRARGRAQRAGEWAPSGFARRTRGQGPLVTYSVR